MPDSTAATTFPSAVPRPSSTPTDTSPSGSLQVNEPIAEFADIRSKSELVRTLMGGTRAMRHAGKKYLPEFPNEEADDALWESRLLQSYLYNAYKLAHGVMVGKAFSHPVVPDNDVPRSLLGWMENINLRGDHLNIFAQQVFGDSLHPGRGYILVEFPKRPPGLPRRPSPETLARLNLRPYFSYLCADRDVLSVEERDVNGTTIVDRVRYRKTTTERNGWDLRTVEKVYVWDLEPGFGVTYKVFREPPSGSKAGTPWEREDAGPVLGWDGQPLTRIPLAKFIPDEDGPFLDDLAWKCLEHWQSASDQRNVLHIMRVIAFLVYGVDKELFLKDKPVWGPGSMYFFSKGRQDAGMEFLKYDGDVEPGERDLQHIEEQLVTLSLEPLLNRPGNLTATAKALDQARANSRLLAAVLRFEDTLEMAMEFAAVDYMGEKSGGQIKLNRDFGISMAHDEELRTLLGMRLPSQKGQRPQVSLSTFYRELKRRGTLMDDTDPEEEVERLVQEGSWPSPTQGSEVEDVEEGKDENEDEGEDKDGGEGEGADEDGNEDDAEV